MRALASRIIQAKFCCQCSQLVALVRPQLPIDDSPVKQDHLARHIDIGVDAPGQRRRILICDVDFD
ncbi:hypothetical protein A5630_21905 [Mycolicibacterium mucogenicum]|uniref:Uncharacterized protein n=1 Tax=Mycolicibacterium mucogenicum TaxID=56689 RepID=A0A1A3H2T7_MYCMU|nr:hypothetical protein [Mycolicibacterium mucogenicum]OBJ41924.1 hypothetical protein A5630_21905 [Mycolicibacterium mucogenicum]